MAASTISVTSQHGSAHSMRSTQMHRARSAWGGRTDSMAGVSDDSANSSRRFGAAWGTADQPGNQKPPTGARALLPGGKEAKATVTRFLYVLSSPPPFPWVFCSHTIYGPVVKFKNFVIFLQCMEAIHHLKADRYVSSAAKGSVCDRIVLPKLGSFFVLN